MKNPLRKRFKRELRFGFGRYLAIFLFLATMIAFCSGYFVSIKSVKTSYDNSFDKFNIEDGHFIVTEKLNNNTLLNLEKLNIKVFESFYKDEKISEKKSIRIFKEKDRENINKYEIFDGKLPQDENEIAIDRVFSKNNNIKIGDNISVGNNEFKVSGLVVLSDYSALFKDNSSIVFDAINFSVGLMNDSGYDKLSNTNEKLCYTWKNNEKLSDEKAEEKSKAISNEILKTNVLTNIIIQKENNSISYSGNDFGSDSTAVKYVLYISITIFAFIFSVTTRSNIEHESKMIGTLRASGYTRWEMLKHYMTLPILTLISSATVGNIFGYTLLKSAVANLYYDNYSLTSYTTVTDIDAFILTTVIPCILTFTINFFMLYFMLKKSPLKFLRKDLSKKKNKSAIKLPERMNFFTRFHLRVILQNKLVYAMIFVGIFFMNLLMMFTFGMIPLIDNHQKISQENAIAKYQYILKEPVLLDDEKAEKYAITILKNNKDEDINVYGISKNSKFLKDLKFADKKEAYVSNGMYKKFNLKLKDKSKLYDKFTDDDYEFTIKEIYNYPATFSIFIDLEDFNEIFGNDKNYFNGYFADEKISKLDENNSTLITQNDLSLLAEQMNESFSGIMNFFILFTVSCSILITYLLSRIIIEKNQNSISMTKILGFSKFEINKLYNITTAVVVVISSVLSLFLCRYAFEILFYSMLKHLKGWLSFYMDPSIYIKIFVINIISYTVIYLLLNKKITKISMAQALKNIE